MKATWLSEALGGMSLYDADEGYLYGRGGQASIIAELGCVTWDATEARSGGPQWLRQFGKGGRGEHIDGWLVLPLLGPRGQILGFESRRTDVKEFNRWLMPAASWNPIFAGLVPSAMGKIWEGADVWLVEGAFDLFALQWAIPDNDVVLGTITAALNRRQAEFLRRFCRGWVHVVYDNDEPGRRGTHGWRSYDGKFHWGALQKLKALGLRSRDVKYTGAKDPGEIWDREGARGVRAAFNL